ncbi:Piso0_005297 [Millerozyma farinosa CBS 7064]|uniref:Piso0_005297 protein n=1 Tax=Pichia sorbitophila (strain ATCC MYA-4447 / BCRC 22081 / CBS 7064 / NBRC 10061 / NRRL Y-12695) TaxID=559304 RepID=G8Y4Q8_PICSO|nr:Piso0_005297 [Millerozyma farinosa CBS 7064]
MNVVIVGAGVVGLTTALQLKKSNPQYQVTVLASHLPGDLDIEYTSPFAGANWHSFATKDDVRLQEIDKVAYKEFLRLAKEDDRAGIHEVFNYTYFSREELERIGGDSSQVFPWFKDYVKEFSVLDSDLPEGVALGVRFKGVVITVSIYLNYLLNAILAEGVKVKRVKKLQNLEEAKSLHHSGKEADIVVNAAGLNASKLQSTEDPDPVYPVKGQVIHVRNNSSKVVMMSLPDGPAEEMIYVMPRKEGGSIIGGCFQTSFASTEEDRAMTQRILQRAKELLPELVDPSFERNPNHFDVVRVQVGLRPFRKQGPRIEFDQNHKWLIHSYGAGGGGYQGSYGMAQKVVSLMQSKLHHAKL